MVLLLGTLSKMADCFARKYAAASLGHDQDDLRQVAMIGAMDAIRNFKPARGVKLSTIACHRMRGQILDHLRSHAGIIKQPRVDLVRSEELLKAAAAVKNIKQFKLLTSSDETKETNIDEPSITESGYARIDDRDQLDELLKKIDWKARYAMRRWSEGATMKQIGEALEVSESWVSQIMNQALEELQRAVGKEPALKKHRQRFNARSEA